MVAVPATLQLAAEAIADLIGRTGPGRICYRWLDATYKQRGLTQHALIRLEKDGYLTQVDSTRGKHSAYYEPTPKFAAHFGHLIPAPPAPTA